MLHYVKKLGRKNYWRKSRSVRVFSKNCASNFFRSDGLRGPYNGSLAFTIKMLDNMTGVFNSNFEILT